MVGSLPFNSGFDSGDPYPLWDHDSVFSTAAKIHAGMVDTWLGLRIAETEALLQAGARVTTDRAESAQTWIGTAPDVFLTPYVELRFLLEQLSLDASDHLVDLGAGYGRLGFVMARHAPAAYFTGVELVEARVRQAQLALERSGLVGTNLRPNIKMIQGDLESGAELLPPAATIFFIYDYGTERAVAGTLSQLRDRARQRPIRVVGRGRRSRDLIERHHPWLSGVHPPQHWPHFSIYQS